MNAKFLLLSTNPLPAIAIWPNEMQPYFEEIALTYNLRLNYIYKPCNFSPYEPISLNKRIAITTLSMGKDSLHSLLLLIENAYYKKIVVIFVNNANYGANYREKHQFVKFRNWFQDKGDGRINFHEIEFGRDVVGLQSQEVSITIENKKIKEPITKLQYVQLLAAPIIRHYKCGTFIVPMDFQQVVRDPNSYFGDMPSSFVTFNGFFSKYIGGKILIKFQGNLTSREEKITKLIEANFFKFNSSCYMNWNFFHYFQNKNKLNPDLNMCGSCWKCAIDLKIIKNLIALQNLFV